MQERATSSVRSAGWRTQRSTLALAGMLTMMLASAPLYAQQSLAPIGAPSWNATGDVEAGAFLNPAPANFAAKYQQYRDLAQQIIAPELHFLLGDNEQHYYFDFRAINTAEKNERYALRFGDYGKLDVQAQWFEIPNFDSYQVARSPYHLEGDNLVLPSKPTSAANFGPWLDTNAHPLNLSLLWGIANLHVRYTPTPNWTYSLDFEYLNPSGDQPLGALFGPNPGSFNETELFAPIEYDIYNYGAGVEYANDGWVLGFKYQGSFFRNSYETLNWQNPVTWNNPVGPSGACANTASYSPSGGLGPCSGQAALYPDNEAHNFTLNAGATLPLNTHLMASGSYGFWLQDSPFIPFSDNSAIPTQALPRSSLGGDVQPAFINATLTSNPLEATEVKATYSYYNYDNRTSPINFRNVLSLNDVPNLWNATAYPFSFSQQNLNLELAYDLPEHLRAAMVGMLQTYHNSGFEVLQQDMTSYGPQLDWVPYSWLTFHADYTHAFRDSPGYNNNRASLLANNAGGSELDELYRFDEATVYVEQTTFMGSVTPFQPFAGTPPWLKQLSLFAEFDYDYYHYPSSTFGTQYQSDYSPSVGFTWDPVPRAHLFGDLAWEAYDMGMRSLARLNTPPNQNPADRIWNSVDRNQGLSVDFGFDVALPTVENNWLLKRQLRLFCQYTYSDGYDTIHSSGNAAGPAATNWPALSETFQEVILGLTYQIDKHAALNLGYYYNHYGFNDFKISGITAYMPGVSPNGGAESMFLGDNSEIPFDASAAFLTFSYRF